MKTKLLELKRRRGIQGIEEYLDQSNKLKLLNKKKGSSEYKILLRVPIQLKGSVGYMTVPTYILIKGNNSFSFIQCYASILKLFILSLIFAFSCPLIFLAIYGNLISYFISAFVLFFILYFYFTNQLTNRVNELICELQV